MTTDNRAFRITIFPDRWARTMRAIQVSEPGLIVPTLVELINSTTAPTKERLPLLKLAFGPTNRCMAAFAATPTSSSSTGLRSTVNLACALQRIAAGERYEPA
jgi:hypothetical protein